LSVKTKGKRARRARRQSNSDRFGQAPRVKIVADDATSTPFGVCLGALHDGVGERFGDDLDALKVTAPQLSHDWGSQFTSRRYQAELSTLGIRSRPTMIGSPEQNEIMERFFGSMKDEEVWTTEYDTRADAIEAIDAWIDDYRTERPHQSLGYLTPAEYRAAALDSTCATQAA
jgi:putative transposase